MARLIRLSSLSQATIYLLSATTTTAHVLMPFSRHVSKLSGRDTSNQASLHSDDYAYLVDVKVGTPPQSLQLVVSPSSSGTWVPDATASQCDNSYYREMYANEPEYLATLQTYCDWGSYNYSTSSSYLPANYLYSSFSENYLDGTSSSGTNMTDKLVVGGIEMEDYPMGVVTSSSSWVGKLGLGPKTVYSSYSSSSYYAGNYPNFLQRMVSSGKIVTPSYSMWLDDAEGKSGSLLFGAVDQSRFEGSLVRLDGSSSQSYPGTYGITLNALNGTSDSNTAMAPLKSNDYPFIMSVSPGEPFSYFPPLLAAKMMTMAGARYNRTVRKNVIDCDAAKTRSASFTIELGGAGGPMLNVPLSDLIMPRDTAVGSNSYARYFASGPANMCPFGIQNTTSLTYSSSSSSYSYSEYSLGTSLLRRSYLVFDQLNEEVSIAPVKFVASGASKPSPTIVAFASSGAPAPSADRFCTPGTSVSGYYCSSSGGGGGGGSGGGGTDTGSGSSGSGNSTSSNTERASWEKIVIGLSVSFGTILLVALFAGVIIWSRLCRGGRKEPATKDIDGESTTAVDATGAPVMSGGAGTGVHSGPPVNTAAGALPIIQERHEDHHAPQLPALATQAPIGSMSPVGGETPSHRDSAPVSAMSRRDEELTAEEIAAAKASDVPPPPPAAPVSEVSEPAPTTATSTDVPAPDREAPAVPKGKGKEIV